MRRLLSFTARLLVALLVASLCFGVGVLFDQRHFSHNAYDAKARRAGDDMAQVVQAVLDNYYQPVDLPALETAAIKGALGALPDGHDVYLTSAELSQQDARTYVGIGVVWTSIGSERLVEHVDAASPADHAGVQRGDVVLRIDGRPAAMVNTMTHATAGVPLHLVIRRPGTTRLISLSIKRDKVIYSLVETRLLHREGHAIGYIRLAGFDAGAARQVMAAVSSLSARSADAFILDVRCNPGGDFDEALGVVATFLGQGVACQTIEGRDGQVLLHHTAGTGVSQPVVVLVDHHSASASEMTSTALQANRRATIIGTRTFGKGVGETTIPFHGGQLCVTNMQVLGPHGEQINGVGVRPDIVARDDPRTARDEVLQRAVRFLLAAMSER
jgi:carboxyl-terminal processing protease